MTNTTVHPIRSALLKNRIKTFACTLDLRGRIYGGIPKNETVIKDWINAVIRDEHQSRAIATATKEAMGAGPESDAALAEELGEASWTGFKSDGDGLYLEGRCIKALLKECANILRLPLKVTAFKARAAERFFVVEDKVHLGVLEADGYEERPVHAMTRMGPITALKRSDYVEQPTVRFTVECLDEPWLDTDKKRHSPEAILTALLDYGRRIGVGSGRSQGGGQYELAAVDLIDNQP